MNFPQKTVLFACVIALQVLQCSTLVAGNTDAIRLTPDNIDEQDTLLFAVDVERLDGVVRFSVLVPQFI